MMTKSLFAIKLGTNETIMALCTKKYNIYTFAEYPECFKNLIQIDNTNYINLFRIFFKDAT